jgi:RNA polymerase sigma-70 factor (ECF subfamily)
VGEVAAAFLSRRAAMEKRIARGKKVLASSTRLFDLDEKRELPLRLSAVQRALYLLFSEGYHGAHAQMAVRTDLCREAMHLSELLLEHPLSATPASYALAALMCLDAARLPARVDAAGNLSSLHDQDRSLWDRVLIEKGEALLDRSATGTDVSEYHMEAAIASVHARARTAADTRWDTIVGLYDTLMAIRPSPIVALNRAIAIAQREGPARGLEAIEAISDRELLSEYPFYFAALAELELRSGRAEAAREYFLTAQRLARNPMERRFFEQRASVCVA